MANIDRPNGLRPFGPILRVRPYRADGAVAEGDGVKRAAGDTASGTLSDVVVATAGAAMIGVAAHAAAAGETVMVYDHPDQEFVIQADGAEVDQMADMGKNAPILATASVDGQSRHELDSSDLDTTATDELKLLRLAPILNNELGQWAKCVVKINNHQLAGGTGTAGV